MMIYNKTLLPSVAWLLLIVSKTQVDGGIIFALSSSSGYETFCNGMRCPSGSSCTVQTNVINGNETSDKSCSNINGAVVRREIITVSNGEMCIKNITMVGDKVNVEQSCRNLSKSEAYYLKQKQDAFEVAMQERSKLHEKQWHEMQRGIKKKTEALQMQAQSLKQAAEGRAEQLKARLAKMERNLKLILGRQNI